MADGRIRTDRLEMRAGIICISNTSLIDSANWAPSRQSVQEETSADTFLARRSPIGGLVRTTCSIK